MAGGTWTNQNKRQPGIYINVKSDRNSGASVGERGIVTICRPLSWGPEKQVLTVGAGDDYTSFTGYGETAEQTKFLREIFKGSDHTAGPAKVLLYRPGCAGAAAAAAAAEPLTVTALYKGVRGNDITVRIAADPDGGEIFLVQTIVDGAVKDEQRVKEISELKENDWVRFSGTGAPKAAAGLQLTGGADGTVAASAYSDYLTAVEPYPFNIMIYDGGDQTVKDAVAAFVKRMRNDTGMSCQAVMAEYQADSENVISVKNGVILTDGTVLSPEQTTWWTGGAQAGAAYNESLTYAKYPGAERVSPRLTQAQLDEALEDGQLVFMEEFGSVKLVSDINTLVSFTPDKGGDFQLNQVIRTLDTAANDIYKHFSQSFIGKMQNNAAGRDLLKSWIIGYLNEMQAAGALQNFKTEDVTVSAGAALNAVVIDLALQPVAAVEKIYISVRLTDE